MTAKVVPRKLRLWLWLPSPSCEISACSKMPSALEMAKRNLARILRELGRAYGVAVALDRSASAEEMSRAFRQVSRKVHPDKPGGRLQDFQRLSAAHDAWADLEKSRAPAGRPPRGQPRPRSARSAPSPQAPELPLACPEVTTGFRVRGRAVLLTYQSFDADKSTTLQCWSRFLDFVKQNKSGWGVNHWTATMETNRDGKHHAHLMLDFRKSVDRYARHFSFEGRCPNAAPNDLLGVGWSRSKQWQASVDRGHFYVWADKDGTVRDCGGRQCVAGNYEPAWTAAKEKYAVKADWPENLWKAYKLSDSCYHEYLFLCKDKLVAKKRNFEAFQSWRRTQDLARAIEQRTSRIRSDPRLYQAFGRVALADEFLALFQQEAMRYPVLLVHAPSFAGKSEWAVSLFKHPLYLEIGAQGLWPAGMKQLNREVHDGLVLDDLRDLNFIHENQEKLQGKYNRPVTLFNTPGGELACTVDLYRLPIVFTVNNSTRNLDYLKTHDFCKKKDNVRLLCFRGRPGQSMVTETLPEEGEEEGAWERFAEDVFVEDDGGVAVDDPYM